MTMTAADRRASRRVTGQEDQQTDLARVRPGHDATVVDLSVRGALLETSHRLLPGAWVELQWLRDGRWGEVVRGRVLRSYVVEVRADAVGYRGAVLFDDRLSWFPE